MLLTNGFTGARALVQGLVQGLRKLGEAASWGSGRDECSANNKRASVARAVPLTPTKGESTGSLNGPTLLQAVLLPAVRTAGELLAPETAREIRSARRKLGLSSLTISERKAKTEEISRAVEARVLIAGFVRALVGLGTAGEANGLGLKASMSTAAPVLYDTTKVAAVAGVGRAAATAGEAGGNGVAGVDGKDIDARRAAMVLIFEQNKILSEILKPLVELEVRLVCARGAPLCL